MNIIEKIKDIFGVMDDVQDYEDKVKKETGPVLVLLKSLEEDASRIRREVSGVMDRDDPKEVARLMERLDLDRPFVTGKTALNKLVAILEDLKKLQRKLDAAPGALRKGVGSTVSEAIVDVSKAINNHSGLLRDISELQGQRKKAVREVLGTAAIVGLGIGGVALTSFVGSTLSTMATNRHVRVGVERALGSFQIRLSQGLSNFRRLADEVSVESRLAEQEYNQKLEAAKAQIQREMNVKVNEVGRNLTRDYQSGNLSRTELEQTLREAEERLEKERTQKIEQAIRNLTG